MIAAGLSSSNPACWEVSQTLSDFISDEGCARLRRAEVLPSKQMAKTIV
jgi:hypothetical protein